MRYLKMYALLALLAIGFQLSAQTSKRSKSAKAKSSKSKSHEPAKSTTDEALGAADSAVADVSDVVIEPLPPKMMAYFVNAYPEFSTLVKGINATRLNETFESETPITVFAPVNRTFDNLPAGTIKNILQPEMSDSLKGILTYIIISGHWTLADLAQKVKEGGGAASIPTVGGMGNLTFILDGSMVKVKDNRGTVVQLSEPVVTGSGLVYVVDRLLLP